MKAMILSIAVVMAATGCKTMEQKGYIKDPAGYWVRGDRPYFGDGKPWAAPGQARFDPTVFNQAMAAQQAPPPQPVIVMGPDSPAITTVGTAGGTTVISGIGNRAPIYRPPPPAYYGY
jgi:hypothetical protein